MAKSWVKLSLQEVIGAWGKKFSNPRQLIEVTTHENAGYH